jgi:hypothetical protein
LVPVEPVEIKTREVWDRQAFLTRSVQQVAAVVVAVKLVKVQAALAVQVVDAVAVIQPEQ